VRRHRTTSTIALVLVLALVAVVGSRHDPSAATGAEGRRVVAVAARDLGPGDVVADDDLEWRAIDDDRGPNAVTRDDAPVGRSVTAAIDAGEVVSRRRLAPGGLRGVAALVPTGSVAMAVERDERTPALEAGQRVDVLTTAGVDPTSAPAGFPAGDVDGDPDRDDGGGGGVRARRVAAGALVVDVAEDRVLVAVLDADAPAFAAALLDGAVVLALTGGAEP